MVLSAFLAAALSLPVDAAPRPLAWRPLVIPALPRIEPRSLQFEITAGALMTDNGLLAAAVEGSSPVLVRVEPGGKQSIHSVGPVFGLAFDPSKSEVFVRGRAEVQVLDSADLRVLRKFSFPRTGGWGEITFHEGTLYALSRDSLVPHNPVTGEVSGAPELLGLSKTQRVLFCGTSRYLWSSYSGAKLFKWEGGLKPLPAPVPHRAFFRLVCADGRPAAADPMTGVYQAFVEFAGAMIPASGGIEEASGGEMLRHSPRKDELQMEIVVRPEADLPAGRTIAAVLPLETATMQIESETVREGSVSVDRDGNRILRIILPGLRAGSEWRRTVYIARITRFKLEAFLNGASDLSSLQVPAELRTYLEDAPQYRITDPRLTELRDSLKASAPTVDGYLNAVYREILKRLVYRADGRFDSAPVVLAQGHGSCTEHTYAQIALLRSAGIPARMAWNWLPGEIPEFNHKIAEAWHPRAGWIPMEPLAPPRRSAGTTHARHIVFSVLAVPQHSVIRGGDRLVSFTEGGVRAAASAHFRLQRLDDRGAADRDGDEADAVVRPSGRAAGDVIE